MQISRFKKLTTASSLLFILSSCVQDNVQQHINTAQSFTLKDSEARNIANAYYTLVSEDISSRNNNKEECIANITLTADKLNPTDSFYIVNYTTDGYALISNRRIANPLIAVVKNGTFSYDSINPAARKYISALLDVISSEETNQNYTYDISLPSLPSAKPTLVKVKWGQTGIFGDICPNYTAGCGPTAMAQIMSVYEHPKTISFNINERDFIETLDWSTMKEHNKVHRLDPDKENGPRCSQLCTNKSHTSITRLMYALGYWSNSTYNNNFTTSTSPSNIKPCLERFGYTANRISPTAKLLSQELKLNRPLLIVGWEYSTGDGHIWVCDGVQSFSDFNSSNPQTTYYFHFNWGWEGESDGYYRAIGADSFPNIGHQFTYHLDALSVYK